MIQSFEGFPTFILKRPSCWSHLGVRGGSGCLYIWKTWLLVVDREEGAHTSLGHTAPFWIGFILHMNLLKACAKLHVWCQVSPCDILARITLNFSGYLGHLDFAFSPWKLAAACIHFAGWGFSSFCSNLRFSWPVVSCEQNLSSHESTFHWWFPEQMWCLPPPWSQMACQKGEGILGAISVW